MSTRPGSASSDTRLAGLESGGPPRYTAPRRARPWKRPRLLAPPLAPRSPRRTAEKLNPIHAVYIAGWLRHLDADKFANIHSNVGLGYALHDEGGLNKNHDGDLRRSPEALAVIKSGLPTSEQVDHVSVGKGYGSPSNRSYRIVNNDHTLHFIQPMTPSAIQPVLQFFGHTLGTPHPVTNQIWWPKELFNGLCLVSTDSVSSRLSSCCSR